jgi:hypothetical protein
VITNYLFQKKESIATVSPNASADTAIPTPMDFQNDIYIKTPTNIAREVKRDKTRDHKTMQILYFYILLENRAFEG